jgi:hypothetical protein
MKRKLKQGKIQVTFEFDFIGSDEAFDKIKDSQIIEDNIGLALQSVIDCHPNLNIDDESIKAIYMTRLENVEDYQA